MAVSIAGRLHSRLSWKAFALFILVAVVSACGDSQAPEFPDVPAGAPVMDQDGLKFRPGDLSASAGEAVFFTNSERALHTITIDGENVSGSMSRGEAFAWTFDAPGEYEVTCDFHPQMRATITVE